MTVALVGMCGYAASYLSALLDAGGSAGAGRSTFKLAGLVDPFAARSARMDEVLRRGIPVFSDLAGLYSPDEGPN